MDAFINAFLGRKFLVYYPKLIVSTTATLLNLVTLVEEGSFCEGMMLILLNDVLPIYIV